MKTIPPVNPPFNFGTCVLTAALRFNDPASPSVFLVGRYEADGETYLFAAFSLGLH